jgi:phage terminase large subunit-like protein
MFQPASNLHLPPVGRSHRRRLRPPPTPCYPSMASKNAAIAENVSALKAKYTDYTTWLKASTRNQNREPVLTQELLKNSLCQMGIDTGKAEQLVSTCTWYVYQFQKDLKIDPEQNVTIESKEQQSSRQYKNKSKKATTIREHSGDSATTITSLNKGT